MLLTRQHIADAGLAPYLDKTSRAWFINQTNWQFRNGMAVAVVSDDVRSGVWMVSRSDTTTGWDLRGTPIGGDASQIPHVLAGVRQALGLPASQADE